MRSMSREGGPLRRETPVFSCVCVCVSVSSDIINISECHVACNAVWDTDVVAHVG